MTSAPIGAFALRYDFIDWGSSRPFFDIGTIFSPFEKVRYSRSYLTSLGAVSLGSSTNASDYAAYGRAWWISRLSGSRRDRGLGRAVAAMAARQRLQRSDGRRSIRSMRRSRPEPTAPIWSRSADNGRICSARGVEGNINGFFVQSFNNRSGIVAAVTATALVIADHRQSELGRAPAARSASASARGGSPISSSTAPWARSRSAARFYGGIGLRINY